MQKRRGTKMERTLESLFLLLLSAFILMEREKKRGFKATTVKNPSFPKVQGF